MSPTGIFRHATNASVGAASQRDAGAGSTLTELSRRALSERLIELSLDSPAMGQAVTVRVLLPAGYADHSSRRYPTLFLLHGGGSAEGAHSWTVKGDAEALTADTDMIVVMPDGGNGLYSDWLVPASRHGYARWETLHIRELVPWVDATFRTVSTRAARACAGLSAGGFGALSYAARHPSLFGAAAAFSGMVDTNLHPWIVEIAALLDDAEPTAVWGSRQHHEHRWRAHNPWDLADRLGTVQLILSTGTGVPGDADPIRAPVDPVELAVHQQGTSLHERLEELGIPHRWRTRRGTHSWPYWRRDLASALPELAAFFGRAATESQAHV